MKSTLLLLLFAACALFGDSQVEAARITHRTPAVSKALNNATPRNGTVTLGLLIDKRGHLSRVQVVTGRPDLIHGALRTVQNWQFAPATVDGRAVDSTLQVELAFRFPS